MAYRLACSECGVKYRYGEAHACSSKPAKSPRVSDGGDVPDKSAPEKSRREKLAAIVAELPGDVSTIAGSGSSFIRDGDTQSVMVRPMTPYERQKRWREKNREAYNRYMREYRKRKK